MRKGGRYIVDPKKSGKPERVEWTRTAEEAKAEAKAGKAAAESAVKPVSETSDKGVKGK